MTDYSRTLPVNVIRPDAQKLAQLQAHVPTPESTKVAPRFVLKFQCGTIAFGTWAESAHALQQGRVRHQLHRAVDEGEDLTPSIEKSRDGWGRPVHTEEAGEFTS